MHALFAGETGPRCEHGDPMRFAIVCEPCLESLRNGGGVRLSCKTWQGDEPEFRMEGMQN